MEKKTDATASSPAIGSEGTIYIGGYPYLSALYPNGTLKWRYYAGDYASDPAIGSDGTVYFRYDTEFCALYDTVPSVPENLTAEGGDGYVFLRWEEPEDDGGTPITGYRIYRGTFSGGEEFYVNVGNVLFYNDTNVTNGMTYYYRVSAVNGIGEGKLSVEVNATPLGVPGAPVNVTATGGDGYVFLRWEEPEEDGGTPVTGYRIYRGTVSGGEEFYVSVGNVSFYNDTNVTNGRTYYYRVSAVNIAGEGELSVEVNATPLGVPGAPVNVTATGGDGYVELRWEAPEDDGGSPITGYRIYRGTVRVGEEFYVSVGNVLFYRDTNVTNGRTYYYRVSAVNTAGEGELSVEVSATPVEGKSTIWSTLVIFTVPAIIAGAVIFIQLRRIKKGKELFTGPEDAER